MATVLTTHETNTLSHRYEIFAEFDELVLLGTGGKTVYSGPVECVADYFTDIGWDQ